LIRKVNEWQDIIYSTSCSQWGADNQEEAIPESPRRNMEGADNVADRDLQNIFLYEQVAVRQ
jgi:hypothetical protein